MKSHIYFPVINYFILLLFIVSATAYSQAQFIKTNGPEGGDITDITSAADNIILLTTRHGGFFISFDSGENWHQRNNGIKMIMPGLIMLFSVEYVNGYIFIGSNQHGIYRSSDFGENFEQVNNGITTGTGINVTKIVSNSNGDLFAVIPAFSGDKIIRSLNSGDSWEEMGSGLPGSVKITDITIDLSFGRGVDKMFVGTTNGVFLSENNGISFQENNLGLNNLNIISIRSSNGTTVAGSISGVHILTSGLNTWMNIDGLPNAPVSNVCIMGQEITIISRGNYNSEYGSTNLGGVWNLIHSHRSSDKPVLFHNNNFQFYGDHISLVRKNHHGGTWGEKMKGLTAIPISRLSYDESFNLYALSSDDFGDYQQATVYRLPTLGDSWERFYEFPRYYKIVDINYPYAVGNENGGTFRGKIFKHNIITNLFEDIFTNPSGTYRSVAQRNTRIDNIVVVVGLGGTAKTTDGGNSFSTNMIGGYHVIYEEYRQKYFLGGNTGLQMSDDGLNWDSPITSDGPVLEITSAVNGYLAYKTPTQLKLFDLNNNTRTLSTPTYGWQPLYFNSSIGFDSENDLWAGVINPIQLSSHALKFNYPYTTSWDTQPTGNQLRTSILGYVFKPLDFYKNLSSSDLFIATAGSGVWIYGEPTSVEDDFSIINAFILYQNYPNPFNPSTTLSFVIGHSSSVTLKVYDLLGREIATLVDEYKPAGSYKIEFDASQISSGVYFYTLQAGEFRTTKKLLLLK